MSHHLDHIHLGTVCHQKTNASEPTHAQNWTILSSAIPEKFKEV